MVQASSTPGNLAHLARGRVLCRTDDPSHGDYVEDELAHFGGVVCRTAQGGIVCKTAHRLKHNSKYCIGRPTVKLCVGLLKEDHPEFVFVLRPHPDE